MNSNSAGSIYQEYDHGQLAERGWKFFMELRPGNVFLAGLLKLISKRGGGAQRQSGILARMCGEVLAQLALGC